MSREPFTITERIKVNPVEATINSFKDIAHELKSALKSGMIQRGKRYKLILKEV